MAKTICLVVGLPGSGKSRYLEQLQKSGFFTINNPENFDKDVLPYLDEPDQVIAIADYHLCFPSSREKMVVRIGGVVQNVSFRWVYFENDPIHCLSNLRAAGVKLGEPTTENFIWQVSQGYSIPTNIETRPIMDVEAGEQTSWLSYAPSTNSDKAFKLVRVADDLVIYTSPDWEKFRPVVMLVLQKYPTHRFTVVEEVITRSVKDLGFDRLIIEKK
jgi:hypothetical protein